MDGQDAKSAPSPKHPAAIIARGRVARSILLLEVLYVAYTLLFGLLAFSYTVYYTHAPLKYGWLPTISETWEFFPSRYLSRWILSCVCLSLALCVAFVYISELTTATISQPAGCKSATATQVPTGKVRAILGLSAIFCLSVVAIVEDDELEAVRPFAALERIIQTTPASCSTPSTLVSSEDATYMFPSFSMWRGKPAKVLVWGTTSMFIFVLMCVVRCACMRSIILKVHFGCAAAAFSCYDVYLIWLYSALVCRVPHAPRSAGMATATARPTGGVATVMTTRRSPLHETGLKRGQCFRFRALLGAGGACGRDGIEGKVWMGDNARCCQRAGLPASGHSDMGTGGTRTLERDDRSLCPGAHAGVDLQRLQTRHLLSPNAMSPWRCGGDAVPGCRSRSCTTCARSCPNAS
eukprot:scaffold452_cov491-Prasinococcus_capsulatus_cf.AAC.1